MSNMKPGYLLKVTTWENDADNYRTTEHHSTLSDEIDFLIDVCEMFYSCNDGGKYGNADTNTERVYRENDAELLPDVKALVDSYKKIGKVVPLEFDYTKFEENDPGRSEYHEDWLREALWDLIGTWNDGEYWRVFESYKVFFLPSKIEDITEQFRIRKVKTARV